MAHPAVTRLVALLGPLLSADLEGTPEAAELDLFSHPGVAGQWTARSPYKEFDYVRWQQDDLPGRPGVLTRIEFLFTAPRTIERADFHAVFGPGRRKGGTHAQTTDEWLFWPRGHTHRAVVLVTVPAGAGGERLEVSALTLLRIPPGAFTAEQAAAGKLVVLTDLGATRLQNNPWPEPRFLWAKAGIDDLMTAFRPRFTATIDIPREDGTTPLPIVLEPRRLDDLSDNVVTWFVPETARLHHLLAALDDVTAGRLTGREARGRLGAEAVPAEFRAGWRSATAAKPTGVVDLRTRVTEELNRIRQPLLDHAGFRSFRGAWEQLATWGAQLDLAAGWRLEVYAAAADAAPALLRDGYLYEETHHPEGAPPVAVLLGRPLASPLRAQQVAALTDPLRTPVALEFPQLAPPADPLVIPALERVVRRVERTFVGRRRAALVPEEMESRFTAALTARHPGAAIRVTVTRSATAPDQVAIRMTLPASPGHTAALFRYDAALIAPN